VVRAATSHDKGEASDGQTDNDPERNVAPGLISHGRDRP
jgi:hypothetical protein